MSFFLSKFFLIGVSLLLGGCCYFGTCHQATYTTGVVIDGVSNQAIPEATVRLYYYETLTASSGCFSLGGADALPLEFSVSAPGYKSLVVKAVPGFYRATITLFPEGSGDDSVYEFNEISHDQYTELSRGCP